jgi:hypothetical protein
VCNCTLRYTLLYCQIQIHCHTLWSHLVLNIQFTCGMPWITPIWYVVTCSLPTCYRTDLTALIASVTSCAMYIKLMLLDSGNFLWIQDSHYQETDCTSYEFEIGQTSDLWIAHLKRQELSTKLRFNVTEAIPFWCQRQINEKCLAESKNQILSRMDRKTIPNQLGIGIPPKWCSPLQKQFSVDSWGQRGWWHMTSWVSQSPL